MAVRWYVIQAKSGFEKSVMRVIEDRIILIEDEHFKARFGKVLVPTEQVVAIHGGQRRKSERKFFPGYVLIELDLDGADAESNKKVWHFIRSIPNVLGFIGGRSEQPAPLSEKEANAILERIQSGEEKPKPKVLFEPGEVVRVTEGPFADFNGVVEEVNYEKNRLRVAVLIFGRSTPVDLEFNQVEKG